MCRRNGLPYLALLACCSLLCAVGLLWFSPSSPEEDTAAAENDSPLMVSDIHLGTVAGIALKNESGSLAMMCYQNEWEYIDPPEDTGVDASVVKSFSYRMAHMPAIKALDETTDWSPYGLADPRAVLTLVKTDGSTFRIYLGDQSPFEKGWYVQKENDPHPYVVDEVTARMLRYSVDDFRALDVLPKWDSASGLKGLSLFRLTHDDTILEVRGEQAGNAARFYLTQPFETILDWEIVSDAIYTPLTCLDECRYVGAGLDKAVYGFDRDDVYTLDVVFDGQEWHLTFSDAGDGNFYVSRQGSGQIISVSASFLDFLSLRSAELVSDTLYSVQAADISAIHITSAETGDVNVRFSGTGETLCAELNGRPLDRLQTLSFVQTVTMLPQAGTLTDAADITASPLLQMSFSLRDGTESTLDIIPVTDRYCAVVVNGAVGASVYTSTVTELLREIKGYLAA